jgi:hypothetical protein
MQLLVSNDPNTASILPWGDNPASSPEGWLPGQLLQIVLSNILRSTFAVLSSILCPHTMQTE